MASLVELDNFAVNHADLMNSRFCEQLDYQSCASTHEFDTPPLSPSGSASPDPSVEESYDSDVLSEETLLQELLQCEQLLALEEESDSQNSLAVDVETNLIQDCMWNSQIYEPRNPFGSTGVPTPAPSPPPPEELQQSTQIATATECISPSAVFPTLVPQKFENVRKFPEKQKVRPERRITFPPSNTRIQPQATIPSESGENKIYYTIVAVSMPHQYTLFCVQRHSYVVHVFDSMHRGILPVRAFQLSKHTPMLVSPLLRSH